MLRSSLYFHGEKKIELFSQQLLLCLGSVEVIQRQPVISQNNRNTLNLKGFIMAEKAEIISLNKIAVSVFDLSVIYSTQVHPGETIVIPQQDHVSLVLTSPMPSFKSFTFFTSTTQWGVHIFFICSTVCQSVIEESSGNRFCRRPLSAPHQAFSCWVTTPQHFLPYLGDIWDQAGWLLSSMEALRFWNKVEHVQACPKCNEGLLRTSQSVTCSLLVIFWVPHPDIHCCRDHRPVTWIHWFHITLHFPNLVS